MVGLLAFLLHQTHLRRNGTDKRYRYKLLTWLVLAWTLGTFAVHAEHPASAVSVQMHSDSVLSSPGDIVTFTILVNNSGSDTVYSLVISDKVSAELQYLPLSSRGGDSIDDSDPNGGGLIWHIQSLGPESTAELTFQAMVK